MIAHNIFDRSFWMQPVRFRFGVRTLLFVTMLVGIAMAWVTWQARAERALLLKQMDEERWWRQMGAMQAFSVREDDQDRERALKRWPRLAELEAAEIHLGYEDGKVVFLSFITRPATNDDDVSSFLDQFSNELTSLDTLSLENSRVSDKAIARLGRLQLSELWLDNCTAITDDAIEQLSRMNSLTQLRIPGTSITPDSAEKLRQALPGCVIVEGERLPTVE